MKHLAAAWLGLLAIGLIWNKWRPRPMHVSAATLDDIARREDRSGLGELNTKDAHPFAVTQMRVRRRA